MKKILLLVAMAATMMLSAQAQEVKEAAAPQKQNVPAYRGIIERTQPNGEILRTYLRGDERKHWMMTEDGWQIFEVKKGWLKYAKLNRKGEAVPSCKKAHNKEARSAKETKWLEKNGVKKNVI